VYEERAAGSSRERLRLGPLLDGVAAVFSQRVGPNMRPPGGWLGSDGEFVPGVGLHSRVRYRTSVRCHVRPNPGSARPLAYSIQLLGIRYIALHSHVDVQLNFVSASVGVGSLLGTACLGVAIVVAGVVREFLLRRTRDKQNRQTSQSAERGVMSRLQSQFLTHWVNMAGIYLGSAITVFAVVILLTRLL
jgi:hypothetical protein